MVGNTQNIQFDQIGIKDGLPDNSIRQIMQDKKGFMWFATLNGLSRYDGNHFKNYINNPGSENSLSSSWISQFKHDLQGNIWCLTADGSIHIVAPDNDRIINLQPQIIKEDIIFRDFIIASDNKLWAWGNQGCLRLSFSDDLKKLEYDNYNGSNLLPTDKVKFVYEDKLQNIWIGTETGLMHYHKTPKGKTVFNTFFENCHITCVTEKDDKVWFGTLKNGLIAYDYTTNNFADYRGINARLRDKPIYSVMPINTEAVLAGSNKALLDINIKTHTVKQITHKALEEISAFYKDSRGNIWLKTTNRGTYRYTRPTNKLVYYNLNAAQRMFLGDIDKQLFFEDSNNDFWCGH